MKKIRGGSVAALAALACVAAGASASPALAWSGQSLWVGTAATVAGGTSCAAPGYNTIQSANIADARLEFSSEGQLTDAQKRGWFSKLYEWLRPF